MAVFSRLVPTIASAYALQTILALIFVPQQNEMFYDCGGAVGWVSTTLVALYYPSLKAKFWEGTLPALSSLAPRQLLVSAAVGLWSIRLGTFLTWRAIKSGGDSRFDQVKKDPVRFTFFWLAQATWITLVGLPAWLINTLPAHMHPVLGVRDYLAVGLFVGSFLFESIADFQKSVWRRNKNNKRHNDPFISSGLWRISRHPNYIGEVGIWTGIWALSTTSLEAPYFPFGTAIAAAVSPLFTWYLLRKVSGVPPLERAGDKKFGDNPKWQEYKRTVPVFWPWGSFA